MIDAVRSWERQIFNVHCSHQGHAWLKDDEATQCKQCLKEFSIARRKVGPLIITICTFNNVMFNWVVHLCVCYSTTVETAAISTATVVPVTSWPCPPTLGLCGCATCATPSCCREARPRLPDNTHKLQTHLEELSNTARDSSTMICFVFLN